MGGSIAWDGLRSLDVLRFQTGQCKVPHLLDRADQVELLSERGVRLDVFVRGIELCQARGQLVPVPLLICAFQNLLQRDHGTQLGARLAQVIHGQRNVLVRGVQRLCLLVHRQDVLFERLDPPVQPAECHRRRLG